MRFFLGVVLSCLALPALAGVQVFPSSAELTAERREASFSVTNSGDEAIDVQFRLVPWQPKGFATAVDEAALLQRKALLVYPPVARVEAGARQVFRLILRDRSIQDVALFRIRIGWRSARESDSEPGKINFALGYSLPLMVTAPKAKHDLLYRAVMLDGQLSLEVANRGNRPVYIKRYRWADGSEGDLFGYAWPGTKRYFKIPEVGPPPITVQLRTWGWTPSASD